MAQILDQQGMPTAAADSAAQSANPRRATGRFARSRSPRKMTGSVALSLLPATALFATFFLIPLVVLGGTSLTDWNGVDINYIGLENYQTLFGDPIFWKSVRNTVIFVAVGLAIQIPFGCVVGMILAQHPPGWRILRTIIFIPFVISGAAYALVFAYVYNPRFGLLNQTLGLIGLDRGQDWLYQSDTALMAVAATYVFVLGFVMILVMAEIASIPAELYEAARVDGASGLQSQRLITLPLLRNVIGTCVLIMVLANLAIFDLVYILTAGGPNDSTVSIVLYGYKAYLDSQWGLANAVGVFIVLIGLVLIVLIRRLFRIGERSW